MGKKIRLAAGLLAAVMTFGTCAVPACAVEEHMAAAREETVCEEEQETEAGGTDTANTEEEPIPAADPQEEENSAEQEEPGADEVTEADEPASEEDTAGEREAADETEKETAKEDELFNIEEGTAGETDADDGSDGAEEEKEAEQTDAPEAGTETEQEEPAAEETAREPALIAAPAAEGISSGAWQEDTETIHHDEEGHYEKKKVQKEVVVKPAYDEKVKRYFYECTVCLFRDYGDGTLMDEHLYEHPTGNGNHYYDPVDGDEIYPSYRDKYEYITIHHDAETYMEEVEEDVWKIDRPAWDEVIHSGVYKYYVDGKAVTGTLAAINGETYLFNDEGVPLTGWRKAGDDLYYFGAGGKMQTGWHTRDGKELYNDPATGKAAFSIVLDVDGTPYYFNSEGTAFKEGVVEDKDRKSVV